jgi:hypothetical protein
MSEVLKRIKPFLDLLDAKYLPLLFIASPQAYVVYRWLLEGSLQTSADFIFAVLGSIGFEAVYVSAVVWASERPNRWVWFTSVSALLFSSGIALRVYWQQDAWWSLLHLGYPVISYFYSLTVHSDGEARKSEDDEIKDDDDDDRSIKEDDDDDEIRKKVLQIFQETQDLGKTAMRVGIKKAEVERLMK